MSFKQQYNTNMLFKYRKLNEGNKMSIKNTNDPRVKRTRQLIQDAFVALVGEKGFENVTVQHIAERAPVNRATFYSHYHDKYDLLDKSIEEMLEKLTEVIKPRNRNKEDFQLTFDSPHPSFWPCSNILQKTLTSITSCLVIKLLETIRIR